MTTRRILIEGIATLAYNSGTEDVHSNPLERVDLGSAPNPSLMQSGI